MKTSWKLTQYIVYRWSSWSKIELSVKSKSFDRSNNYKSNSCNKYLSTLFLNNSQSRSFKINNLSKTMSKQSFLPKTTRMYFWDLNLSHWTSKCVVYSRRIFRLWFSQKWKSFCLESINRVLWRWLPKLWQRRMATHNGKTTVLVTLIVALT